MKHEEPFPAEKFDDIDFMRNMKKRCFCKHERALNLYDYIALQKEKRKFLMSFDIPYPEKDKYSQNDILEIFKLLKNERPSFFCIPCLEKKNAEEIEELYKLFFGEYERE